MEQNQNQDPVETENPGKSIKEASTELFSAIKGPVFWLAVGYIACKWTDRKKKS